MVQMLERRGIRSVLLPSAAGLALICLAMLNGRGAAQEAPRPAVAPPVIAVVDMARVLQGSEQWQDVLEENARLVQNRQRALDKKVRHVQVLRNEHESLPPGSAERQRKAGELQEAMNQLELTRREYEAEAAKRRATATRTCLATVGQAIASYARRHDIDIVLKRQNLGADDMQGMEPQLMMATTDVLYAADHLDISTAIIAELNAASRTPIQVK